jgi:hypothetical protein
LLTALAVLDKFEDGDAQLGCLEEVLEELNDGFFEVDDVL